MTLDQLGQSKFTQFIRIVESKDYVVLHTHATKLGVGEIVEISIIDYQGNTLLDTTVKAREAITRDAFDEHGILDILIQNAPTWADIRADVVNHLKGKNIITYAHDLDLRRMVASDKALGNFDSVGHQSNFPLTFISAMDAYMEHRNLQSHVMLEDAADREGCLTDTIHTTHDGCCMIWKLCKSLASQY